MAICKHIASKSGFGTVLEYLTMQHDQSGRLLLDEEGLPIPRDHYLIGGIDCIPETFAPLCLQDRIRFDIVPDSNAVSLHHYIISFSPEDVSRGLTTEKAYDFAIPFAKANFPGHRCLICVHPDGDNKSGNIHIHIFISNLRFRDRQPDPKIMRTDPQGNVLPYEYQAGYAHQDTPFLRKHLLSQINSYCASQGYTVCPEKAKVKITQKEYYLKQKGIETQNDQLRRIIADAVATTDSWEAFTEKLLTGYTQTVSIVPPIPYRERKNLQEIFRALEERLQTRNRQLRAAFRQQLKDYFEELKTCGNQSQKETIQEAIMQTKQEQAKERLFRQTWQVYIKAAALALKSQNAEDAMLCIEQLQELARQQDGYWQNGWNHQSSSFSLLDGTLKSRITWKQITEADHDIALKILDAVQEEARQRKSTSKEMKEIPMPVQVSLSNGKIFFHHLNAGYWVSGDRLGEAFTLESLGFAPPAARDSQTQTYPDSRGR